jgi:hypothetical protein
MKERLQKVREREKERKREREEERKRDSDGGPFPPQLRITCIKAKEI